MNLLSTPTNHPPNRKCKAPAFFGDRYGGKDSGLCTHNLPAEEMELFLYEVAQEFEA
jgi:hypothetical protein